MCAVSASPASANSLLEKVEQETWRETGVSFVASVTRLMERLLDYRYLPGHLPDLKSDTVWLSGGRPFWQRGQHQPLETH